MNDMPRCPFEANTATRAVEGLPMFKVSDNKCRDVARAVFRNFSAVESVDFLALLPKEKIGVLSAVFINNFCESSAGESLLERFRQEPSQKLSMRQIFEAEATKWLDAFKFEESASSLLRLYEDNFSSSIFLSTGIAKVQDPIIPNLPKYLSIGFNTLVEHLYELKQKYPNDFYANETIYAQLRKKSKNHVETMGGSRWVQENGRVLTKLKTFLEIRQSLASKYYTLDPLQVGCAGLMSDKFWELYLASHQALANGFEFQDFNEESHSELR